MAEDRVRYKGRLMTADDAARRKAADAAAAKKTTDKKKDTKKKDTKKTETKKTETKKTETKKSGGGDTAKPMSDPSYRPNVPIASAGSDVFYGTNIPTTGYTEDQIETFNNRLRNEIDSEGDNRGANDVIFDIAYAKGGGQGNERVGAVQSGMWKLDDGPLWAENYINSTNDRYVLRDEQGVPTGERVRFDDSAGVVRGTPGNWTSTGSWGGNARAGILEGQPTTTAPPSGILSSGIRDLDEGGFFATGSVGTPGTTGATGTTGTTGGILGNIPFQDWSRFMPTETPYYQLGEFAGAHYQPWATGTPFGSMGGTGMGGGTAGFAGPDTWATGTTTGGPYTGGGATATGGPGPINPNIWGTDATGSGGNTVTDAQGKTWIMSNGQWIPADSELGSILASGDTPRHPLSMYDANGMWIGAEGTPMGGGTRDILGATQYSGGNIGVNAPAWSDPNDVESADEAFNVNEFSYSPTGTALNSFQDIGLIGNLPGQFSPLGRELERVRMAEEAAATADDLSFTGYNEAVRQSNLARQATAAGLRFQDAMPEMTTPVAEMINARTAAENAARSQVAMFNNANARMNIAQRDYALGQQARNAARQVQHIQSIQNMGPNYGGLLNYNDLVTVPAIARTWAGGNLDGEFDVGPEVDVSTAGGRSRSGGMVELGPEN